MSNTIVRNSWIRAGVVVLALASLTACASLRRGPSTASTGLPDDRWTFESPEAAVAELARAARDRDRDRMWAIFGPQLDELGSGSLEQDSVDYQLLTAAYDRQNALVPDGADRFDLTVGEDGWRFPAPIRKYGDVWAFDTEAGIDEVVTRRIGRNELDAIGTCRIYALAQVRYARLDPDGDGLPSYARKLLSTPGTRDGLWWPDQDGAPRSPLGPLVGGADLDGRIDPAVGYRGYHFRALERQGPAANGGAKEFVDASGRMTGGFALIAWPVDYGTTGIMTFVIGPDGVVFERDLGPDTAKRVRAVDSFDPGTGWTAIVPPGQS